jgi:hypothetical protein
VSAMTEVSLVHLAKVVLEVAEAVYSESDVVLFATHYAAHRVSPLGIVALADAKFYSE